MYIKDNTLVDDDNVIHRIGDCCVFIMDDNYKSNIIGCIADIGFVITAFQLKKYIAVDS